MRLRLRVLVWVWVSASDVNVGVDADVDVSVGVGVADCRECTRGYVCAWHANMGGAKGVVVSLRGVTQAK